MDKESLIDQALALLGDDMDDMEGNAAMAHGVDDCPDPLTCKMHDTESGDALSKPDVLSIEVHKPADMAPGDEGKMGEGSGLDEDEAEILKKLLR